MKLFARIQLIPKGDFSAWGENEVHSFLGVIVFRQHVPEKATASTIKGFPKGSDPEKN